MIPSFPWHELEGSPEGPEISASGASATRRFLVDWGNAYEFAAGFLIDPIFPGRTTGFPGLAWLLVNKVSFSPFGDKVAPTNPVDPVNEINSYDSGCVVTVSYEYSPQDQQKEEYPDNTWATYEQKVGGEMLSIPGRSMLWKDNKKLVSADAHPTILIPMNEHVVSWNHVPRPPWDAIDYCLGRVNNDGFKVPVTGKTIKKECLLFAGAEVSRDFSVSADPREKMWKLRYTFTQRQLEVPVSSGGYNNEMTVTWNHSWRDSPAGWERPVWFDPADLQNATNPKPLYELRDFRTLFQMAVA